MIFSFNTTPYPNRSHIQTGRNRVQVYTKGLLCAGFSAACLPVSKKISSIIFHVAAGIIATALVMKVIDRYNGDAMIKARRTIYHEDYLKFASISLVAILAISMIACSLANRLGFCLGCYCAINLDIDSISTQL